MSRNSTKPPSQRQLRVGEEIRHALARIVERGEIRDPDLAGRMVTITEVRISPDLRNATAFVTPLGGGDARGLVSALRRARSFLRHELAKVINLRYAPELFFEPDTSFDEAGKIEALLRSPEVRRDLDEDRYGEIGADESDSGDGDSEESEDPAPETRRPPADAQEGGDDGA